jgi:hypothetical protein
MNFKIKLQRCSGKRPGDLEWDTDTGRIAGSLAPEVSAGLAEAKAAAAVGWGPCGCLEYPITDPLHKPDEMAVILDAMGFVLPAELAAAYPIPPADLLDDPELAVRAPAERSRAQF